MPLRQSAPRVAASWLADLGIPGYNYAIEASTNLMNWTAIQTNSVPFQFIDVNALNYPMRFYRTVLER